ncbi:MAG: hypothetical protein EPN88_11715 [Bacteroidetes bacterium]|nr:MAG: hypothetical protein EPN88_11715 [Bacteroidota bacterium]
MKIILSRKGFDSANGGYPSPILPDGKMISLPIPSKDFTRYSDLKMDHSHTYFDLMRDLKSKIKFEKKWSDLTIDTKCHLDPDLFPRTIQRAKNWKPCFGQINQAQSHLFNEGVKEDDLFLFFGWFKRTIFENGKYQFDKFEPDLHIIFGYLQIGKKLQVNDKTQIPDWMQNHPHVSDESRKKNSTNTIYEAKENLTWNKNKSGAGIFRFNEDLILTKKGFTRSKWDLPTFFKGIKISRHSEDSWKKEGYFKSVDIGQEFVVEDHNAIENWAKQKIDHNE